MKVRARIRVPHPCDFQGCGFRVNPFDPPRKQNTRNDAYHWSDGQYFRALRLRSAPALAGDLAVGQEKLRRPQHHRPIIGPPVHRRQLEPWPRLAALPTISRPARSTACSTSATRTTTGYGAAKRTDQHQRILFLDPTPASLSTFNSNADARGRRRTSDFQHENRPASESFEAGPVFCFGHRISSLDRAFCHGKHASLRVCCAVRLPYVSFSNMLAKQPPIHFVQLRGNSRVKATGISQTLGPRRRAAAPSNLMRTASLSISPSSWMAMAAGRRSATCRASRAIAPACNPRVP